MKNRNLKILLPLLLASMLLKGCKVPDVKPFASATAEMTAALTAGIDLVLGDLDRATKLDLGAGEKSRLKNAQDSIAAAAQTNEAALAALNNYAQTLAAVAEAGDKGKKSIDAVATALQGVAAAFGPPGAVAGTALANGAKAISGYVQTMRTLSKLEDALVPADAAIQKAVGLLDANLADLASLDGAVGNITEAYLTGANQNVLAAYDARLARQWRADSTANLLVQFDNTALAFRRATGSRRARFQQELTNELASLATRDEEINALGPFAPARLREVLAQVSKREAYWSQRADNGLPASLLAAHDRVQNALAANQTSAANHRNALKKGRALLRAWAVSHASLRRAVTDAKHSVSFQEVLDGAQALRDFIDKLSLK